jgi:hypothetical protein
MSSRTRLPLFAARIGDIFAVPLTANFRKMQRGSKRSILSTNQVFVQAAANTKSKMHFVLSSGVPKWAANAKVSWAIAGINAASGGTFLPC